MRRKLPDPLAGFEAHLNRLVAEENRNRKLLALLKDENYNIYTREMAVKKMIDEFLIAAKRPLKLPDNLF